MFIFCTDLSGSLTWKPVWYPQSLHAWEIEPHIICSEICWAVAFSDFLSESSTNIAFANHISDKGFVSGIYKDFSEPNNKTTNNPIKMVNLHRHFSKEDYTGGK